MGHVSIDDLPLSQKLKHKITAWDVAYQATFNSDYPPDSGFDSPEVEHRHKAEGKRLAEKMQLELGREYRVDYCP